MLQPVSGFSKKTKIQKVFNSLGSNYRLNKNFASNQVFLIDILSLPFFSQAKKKVIKNIGFINGKIVDSKTRTPLSYINITCKNKSKIIITGGITDTRCFHRVTIGCSFYKIYIIKQ